jgi:hypothetical protein
MELAELSSGMASETTDCLRLAAYERELMSDQGFDKFKFKSFGATIQDVVPSETL